MSDYDNTNTGVLFKNDKEGNEKRPDYTGTINIEGDEKRLAAWIRESKKGTKFLSLRISEQQNSGGSQPEKATDGFEDSDMPF